MRLSKVVSSSNDKPAVIGRISFHPDRPGKIVTVPFKAKDIKKGTLKNILKQAELSVDDLLKLL